jgi:hypothetical protein
VSHGKNPGIFFFSFQTRNDDQQERQQSTISAVNSNYFKNIFIFPLFYYLLLAPFVLIFVVAFFTMHTKHVTYNIQTYWIVVPVGSRKLFELMAPGEPKFGETVQA